MSPSKEKILLSKNDAAIACNQACYELKEKKIKSSSIWYFLSRFMLNLKNEICFSEAEKQYITSVYNNVFALIGANTTEQEKEKKGETVFEEIIKIRKTKVEGLVAKERQNTQIAEESKEKIYTTIGSFLNNIKKIKENLPIKGLDSVLDDQDTLIQALKEKKSIEEIQGIININFRKIEEILMKFTERENQRDALLIDLEKKTYEDDLTGLFNQRYYNHNLRYEVESFLERKGKQPFSLIFLDIDNFKSLNDTYGHDLGDEVLKKIAYIMQHTSRQGVETLMRRGGDEFVIFSKSTAQEAKQIAQRIQSLVNKHATDFSRDPITKKKAIDIQVGMSIGITELKVFSGKTIDEHLSALTQVVDEAMYMGKQQKKNQINVLDIKGNIINR